MADELPLTGLDASPESFARSLATLRAHLAELEAAGEEVPVEARELMQRLEALTEALAGLADTMGDTPRAQPHVPGDAGEGPPKR